MCSRPKPYSATILARYSLEATSQTCIATIITEQRIRTRSRSRWDQSGLRGTEQSGDRLDFEFQVARIEGMLAEKTLAKGVELLHIHIKSINNRHGRARSTRIEHRRLPRRRTVIRKRKGEKEQQHRQWKETRPREDLFGCLQAASVLSAGKIRPRGQPSVIATTICANPTPTWTTYEVRSPGSRRNSRAQ